MITQSHMRALNALYNTTEKSLRGRDLDASYVKLREIENAGLISSDDYWFEERPRGRIYKLTEDGERFVQAVQDGSYKLPSNMDLFQFYSSLVLRPFSLILCGALGSIGLWWQAVGAVAVCLLFNWHIRRAEERWL